MSSSSSSSVITPQPEWSSNANAIVRAHMAIIVPHLRTLQKSNHNNTSELEELKQAIDKLATDPSYVSYSIRTACVDASKKLASATSEYTSLDALVSVAHVLDECHELVNPVKAFMKLAHQKPTTETLSNIKECVEYATWAIANRMSRSDDDDDEDDNDDELDARTEILKNFGPRIQELVKTFDEGEAEYVAIELKEMVDKILGKRVKYEAISLQGDGDLYQPGTLKADAAELYATLRVFKKLLLQSDRVEAAQAFAKHVRNDLLLQLRVKYPNDHRLSQISGDLDKFIQGGNNAQYYGAAAVASFMQFAESHQIDVQELESNYDKTVWDYRREQEEMSKHDPDPRYVP